MAFVGGHLGIKQNLEKQIAQFFRKMGKVAALDGIEDFIGFFEGVLADGIECLLTIPGAAAGRTKTSHNGNRLLKK